MRRPAPVDGRVRSRSADWARSLRVRLLAGTLIALVMALALSGVMLGGLFREHVLRQFAATLMAQLDQVTARLEFDADGQPHIDPRALSDPRWSRPYSGLYWQLDGWSGGVVRHGVLRSRSLWDSTLVAKSDALPDGVVHRHEIRGPEDARVLVLERTLREDNASGTPWRLMVAADLGPTRDAVLRFNGVLAASLGVLLILLCAAAAAQVFVGLAPLRSLQRALASMRNGVTARLDGRFPAEVQPLIDDFNAVLDRNAELVARARTRAGNLAHAIKTPLTIMAQGAAAARQRGDASSDLPAIVLEQVGVAQRHVDWHLAHARAAAAQAMSGARAPVAPALAGLMRVMERVHVARRLSLNCEPVDSACVFAGEVQDLEEMLGNVLDNACKWARHDVHVCASCEVVEGRRWVRVTVADDGPGIDAERRRTVMQRGARLDESLPGSGLGLAIVEELATLYGGSVSLGTSPAGGLSVELTLPAMNA